jgi:hypothetical protein
MSPPPVPETNPLLTPERAGGEAAAEEEASKAERLSRLLKRPPKGDDLFSLMVGKSAGYNKEKLGVVDVATEYFSRKQRCVREQCQTTELAAFQHYEQPKENNRKSLLVRFKAKHQQTSCLVGGPSATHPYRVTENALSERKRPKKPTSVICQ